MAGSIYKASCTDRSLTIGYPDDAELAEFCFRTNAAKNAFEGVAIWGSQGRLRTLAKALSDLADACDEAGYAPPAMAEEREKSERLADSVGDRELATAYRAKADDRS